jgi:hypothetical protein
MNSFILDSLNYYYGLKKININSDIKYTDELFNLMPIIYIKENNKYIKKVYNIIGIFDKDNYIFNWAWSTNIEKYKYIKTNKLIIHGINIESKNLQDIYIKKILTTSQIKILNDLHLTILLAISSYLTKNNYVILKNNDKSNYIVFYGIYDINNDDDDEEENNIVKNI